MNILPLIFTFLIIFSCIAFTFLKEVKSFSLIETVIHGYNRTERALSNAIPRKVYKKIKEDKAKKADNQPKEKVLKKYSSMRCLFPLLETSKFNLGPLIRHQGTLKLHPLYEPLANLFRLQYGERVLKKEPKAEKLEYRLIDEILKKAQKLQDCENLAELYPEDPTLRRIFYKMLRGTNQYSNATGIPPLDSFLSLTKEEKALSLSFTSPAILEAFFGKEITLELLKVEYSKWMELNIYYYFSKEEFQNIMMKAPAKAAFFTSLDPFLDYSKQFEARSFIGGKDQITGITVLKQIN